MKKLLLLLVVVLFASCNVYRPMHRVGHYVPRRPIIITTPLVPHGGIYFSIPRRSRSSYYSPRRFRR